MKVDKTTALSQVLRDYEQNGANDHDEARMANALTRVIAYTVSLGAAKC